MLDIQAVFQAAYGSGRRKEAILMQRITDHSALHASAHHGDRPRAPGPRSVHARGSLLPGPVGEPASADERLVAALLIRIPATYSPTRCAPPRPRSPSGSTWRACADMLDTWTEAVFVDMNRRRPISPLLRPSATRTATSRSRAVRSPS